MRRQKESDLGDIDGGEGKGLPLDGDERRAAAGDDASTRFEDYDEFAGDNDATPDDRRRDPLRKSW